MKKFLASALMLLAASTTTFAQNAVGSFSLQPKAGISIADMTDTQGTTSRIGFVGGLEGEYQASDIFSLSLGVNYSQEGFKMKNSDNKIKLDYINVPILANVYLTKGLAVKVGVQPGFNVGNSVTVDGNTMSSSKKDYDGIKSVALSIPVGLSYEISNVVLDARYNWGVTKAFDGLDSKNSVFQVTIGYKFQL
ncbi:MAG: porin family protein [Prevotella sp.]|nr:PorT family protein [Prevotella sp.]MDD7190392.1 porin family protein [Prevotella sp.]MDY5314772.1 porin family protein [Prevotella sp.]